MKKTYYFLLLIGMIANSANAQVSQINLNQNDASSEFTDIGLFFNNVGSSTPGYEVPAGSGKYAIYAGAMWYGGKDVNGQVKLTAPSYYPAQQDMWPGILTTGGSATTATTPMVQTIWKVSKAEILNHIANYNSPGYVTPNDIVNWPAHGDISLGFAFYLAPFVDVDLDGIYDPYNGDYPCIKGDEAVYTIANDRGNIHGSGGEPIGIEVHYMFYQYNSVPELMDVTFIEARMINRWTETIFDYVTSFWLDADLGYFADDYFGCDSTRNLMYAYNGDAFDEDGSGLLGYGATPPAIGMVCLNHRMSSATAFAGTSGPGAGPTNVIEYYNVMQGNYTDGTPYLDDLGQPTKYMFNGDPNDPTQWSEVSAMMPPGDRRMLMNVAMDDPGTPWQEILQPFTEHEYTFAVVFGQDSTNLASVAKLFDRTDEVQYYFDNLMDTTCVAGNVSLAENELLDVMVYPNPSAGEFTISGDATDARIEITNVAGKLVYQDQYSQINNVHITLNEPSGIYFVQINSNEGSLIKKISIE